MLIWLDGNTNTKAKPQENFGRELMELFTRGVGFYTEDDVYAAARVFTGWNLQGRRASSRNGPSASSINANAHETSAKSFSFPIYGDGGRTIPARAAAAGMQDGIDLIAALAGHPETARRLATRSTISSSAKPRPPRSSFIDRLADGVSAERHAHGAGDSVVCSTSAEFQAPSVYFSRYSWPAEFVVRSMKETGWIGFSLGTHAVAAREHGAAAVRAAGCGWMVARPGVVFHRRDARPNEFRVHARLEPEVQLATAAAGAKQSPRRW